MLNIVVGVRRGYKPSGVAGSPRRGEIKTEIIHVISSSRQAYALERARSRGISTTVLERSEFGSSAGFDAELLKVLESCQADLIVLAGFLCILGEEVIERYRNRIINVHPSLIPAFCGKGYYGLHVHQAVLSYGVKITGATVHFVNEIPDGGAIILQKAVPVRTTPPKPCSFG